MAYQHFTPKDRNSEQILARNDSTTSFETNTTFYEGTRALLSDSCSSSKNAALLCPSSRQPPGSPGSSCLPAAAAGADAGGRRGPALQLAVGLAGQHEPFERHVPGRPARGHGDGHANLHGGPHVRYSHHDASPGLVSPEPPPPGERAGVDGADDGALAVHGRGHPSSSSILHAEAPIAASSKGKEPSLVNPKDKKVLGSLD